MHCVLFKKMRLYLTSGVFDFFFLWPLTVNFVFGLSFGASSFSSSPLIFHFCFLFFPCLLYSFLLLLWSFSLLFLRLLFSPCFHNSCLCCCCCGLFSFYLLLIFFLSFFCIKPFSYVDSAMAHILRAGTLRGTWSSWNLWGRCSVTCGMGTRVRSRTCNWPPVSSDPTVCTAGCSGNNIQHRQCAQEVCCTAGGVEIF